MTNHRAGLEVVPGEWYLSATSVTSSMPSGHVAAAELAMRDGRLVVDQVTVRQPENGYVGPVTLEVMRSFSPSTVLRHSLWTLRDKDGRDSAEWMEQENFARLRENGPTLETLRALADVYRLAYAIAERPTKMVEDLFGVPRATAARWVSIARRKGLLGEAPKPGKAGV